MMPKAEGYFYGKMYFEYIDMIETEERKSEGILLGTHNDHLNVELHDRNSFYSQNTSIHKLDDSCNA